MIITRRNNKYHAKMQSFGGRTYHSKKEASYAIQLAWQQKAGENYEVLRLHESRREYSKI